MTKELIPERIWLIQQTVDGWCKEIWFKREPPEWKGERAIKYARVREGEADYNAGYVAGLEAGAKAADDHAEYCERDISATTNPSLISELICRKRGAVAIATHIRALITPPPTVTRRCPECHHERRLFSDGTCATLVGAELCRHRCDFTTPSPVEEQDSTKI